MASCPWCSSGSVISSKAEDAWIVSKAGKRFCKDFGVCYHHLNHAASKSVFCLRISELLSSSNNPDLGSLIHLYPISKAINRHKTEGRLAQMVERSLCMREVQGSMPWSSSPEFLETISTKSFQSKRLPTQSWGSSSSMVER